MPFSRGIGKTGTMWTMGLSGNPRYRGGTFAAKSFRCRGASGSESPSPAGIPWSSRGKGLSTDSGTVET